MLKQVRTHSATLFEWWVGFVGHHAPLVLLITFLVTVGVLAFTVGHFRIDMDMSNMISEKLPYRKLDKELDRAFPQLGNTILAVLDGDTPEATRAYAKMLVEDLNKEKGLFKKVYWPGGEEFFKRSGLLYLKVSELEELSDNLASAQPLLGLLSKDFSLRGLFSVIEKLVSQDGDTEQKIKIVPFLDGISEALESAVSKGSYQLSWQELMISKEAGRNMRRQFVIIQPAETDSQFAKRESAIEAVYRIRNELGLHRADNVKVRLTGDIALNYENLLTVRRGMEVTTAISFLLVSIALVIGFGSGRLVIASLLTLLVGLIWTFGFAIAVIGYLNLISVAFAVLFIGLAIDYGIQFCLRYREEMTSGLGHHEALVRTAKGLGISLRLCTVAAAIGFYSFLPTAYVGVSQLGLIAGTGMFINLFATLTVLPAVLTLLPLKKGQLREFRGGRSFHLTPSRYAKVIWAAALVAGTGAIFFIPRLSFDYNPLNLYNQRSEAVSTIKDLVENEIISPWTISILVGNEKEAQECAVRLKGLKEVREAITLSDLVPGHQSEKLAILSDIGLFMPPELENIKPKEVSYEKTVESLKKLQSSLKHFLSLAPGEGHDYLASITRLSRALDGIQGILMDPENGKKTLEKLGKDLLSNLPLLLNDLRTSLRAHRVTLSDYPEQLRGRYESPEGIYRVEVLPSENLLDTHSLKRFVNAVTAVFPRAIGTPVIIREVGEEVVHSFLQAVLYAIIAITIYLLIELRSLRDTVLILLPLTLSLLLTAAASVILDIPFNFANVIVIPLLIGSGVEGIYLIYRFRKEPPPNGNILNTSTARALFFSAFTTILSFSTLSFSSHRGMASMGELLTICMGSLLITTLVLLPALLSMKSLKKNKDDRGN